MVEGAEETSLLGSVWFWIQIFVFSTFLYQNSATFKQVVGIATEDKIEIKDKNKEPTATQSKLKKLERQLDESTEQHLQKETVSLKKIEELETEYAEYRKSLEITLKEKDKIITDLETKIRNIEKKMTNSINNEEDTKKIIEQNVSYEIKLSELNEKLQDLQKEQQEIQSKDSEIKELLNSIKKKDEQIEQISNKLKETETTNQKKINEKEQEILENEKQIQQHKDELIKTKQELQEIQEKKISQIDSLEPDLIPIKEENNMTPIFSLENDSPLVVLEPEEKNDETKQDQIDLSALDSFNFEDLDNAGTNILQNDFFQPAQSTPVSIQDLAASLSMFEPPQEQKSDNMDIVTRERVEGVLIQDFSMKADTNKAGLRKAKKVSFTPAGKKASPQQEDANFAEFPFNNNPNWAIFCVFDGHAGKGASFAGIKLFPEEFKLHLNNQTDLSEELQLSFQNVDEQLKEFEYEGCTATTVFIWQVDEVKYLQAGNVGDSTAFLCRDRKAIQITQDHNPSNPDEKERIRSEGIEIRDEQSRINGLSVSRSLGDHFVKELGVGMSSEAYTSPVYELNAETDTFMIIASDGLWDVMTGQRAMELIQNEDTADKMVSKLLTTALSSPKCMDNITIGVVIL